MERREYINISGSYHKKFRLIYSRLRLHSFTIQETDTHLFTVLTQETCITYARLHWEFLGGMLILVNIDFVIYSNFQY